MTPAGFRLGVNYWPARTAMGWWTAFERREVERDFARIAGSGMESVRIFLTWEDFQPTPSGASRPMIDRLVMVMDAAAAAGLVVMPTLFTGHMSGCNWSPTWARGADSAESRFRVVSQGQASTASLRNWYSDPEIAVAQALLAREVASALSGHPALWAWDLGNENSNCVVPPDHARGREWLLRMTDAIRGADPHALVTLGLHMEDLEQERFLGPREAAEVCDFLTMHGYPGYASWARGPTDESLLPFLTSITRWLGGGMEVVFTEFGVPTGAVDPAQPGPALVPEQEAAAYVHRALDALQASGAAGAMLWCYADYDESRWDSPPLDLAPHERTFGLWRADGSEKAAVSEVRQFAARAYTVAEPPEPTWIDIDTDAFYRDAQGTELARLYGRYRDSST